MVALPATPFDRYADFALVSLMSGLTMESASLAATLWPRLWNGPIFAAIVLLAFLAVATGYLWGFLFARNRTGFSFAAIVCAVLFVAQRTVQAWAMSSVPASVSVFLPVVLSGQVLLALFLAGFAAFRRIKADLDPGESLGLLLSGVGLVLVASAVCGVALTWPSAGEVVAYAVCGVVGFCAVVREGRAVRAVFAGAAASWAIWTFRGTVAEVATMRHWGFAFVLAGLAATLFGFSRSVFAAAEAERRAMETGFDLPPVGEKKCSHCGRPVPPTARAGDVCPHCGVTWRYEDTWDSRR